MDDIPEADLVNVIARWRALPRNFQHRVRGFTGTAVREALMALDIYEKEAAEEAANSARLRARSAAAGPRLRLVKS